MILCLSLFSAPVDICSTDSLVLPEGLVSSRNYPENYSYNGRQRSCTREIVPYLPKAYVMTRIYDLDVERRTTAGCYDHLYLEEPGNPFNYFDYCGNLLNSPHGLQQVFHNKLSIKFQPNAITHMKGFLLYYKGKVCV